MIASSNTPWPRSIEDLVSSELCSRLDRLDLVSRRVFAGKMQGERRSKRRGRSVEFEDHRNYVPGDDLRHIDWNVFARLDRFFIRVFQEEEDLSLHLVLDASASMDSAAAAAPGVPLPTNKALFAARLTMALGYLSLVHNNRVSISILDGRTLRRLPDMRGRRNVQRLGAFLLQHARPRAGVNGPTEDESSAGGGGQVVEADWNDALRLVARSRTGRGIMVVISDFLVPPAPAGYESGLKLLAGVGGGGFDVVCVQVLSPGELDPAGERSSSDASSAPTLVGDLRLTDIETGRTAEVTLNAALLARYRRTVEDYCRRLADFCAARGMNHVLVRSDAPVEGLILETFRRRRIIN